VFTQILNNFLNIRNHVQDKNGVWKPVKEPILKMTNVGLTDMTTSDIVIFNESGKKIVIDSFEYTVNGSGTNTFPTLHLDGIISSNLYDGQMFHTLNSTGGGSRSIATPTRLAGDGSPYFDIMEYDSTANAYKFALKAPIELPQGGRLGFRVVSGYTSGDKITYKAIYRVWE
jgi:hypothetical protein